MDWQPSCAICGCRPTPEFPGECHHEAEALTKALQQALDRSDVVQRIKDWVIDNAKRQIGRTFDELRAARLARHTQYVQGLPCYSLYQRYRGHPPFPAPQLAALRQQLASAQQFLVAGVDEDWRRSCLQYPQMLDYYFGLVEVGLPEEGEEEVREPVLGARSPRRGKARRASGEVGMRRKERRRSRGRTKTPPRAPSPGRWR